MEIDENEISSKSPLITMVLLMILGSLGIHRFYVGKYITGVLYFIFGSSLSAFYLFGFRYAMFGYAIVFGLMMFDLYAIYSDAFTDSKGKLVIGKDKFMIYDSYEERDRNIFIDRLNKIMIVLFGIGFYLLLFIIRYFVF